MIGSGAEGGGDGVPILLLQTWIPRACPVGIQHRLSGGGEVSHRFDRKTNNCAIKSKDKPIGPAITKKLYIVNNNIASTSAIPLMKWRSFSVKSRHEQMPAIIQRAVL
jgi:hypothetical protein